MPPELAPGYFISTRTGMILRKKRAAINGEMEVLRKSAKVEEPAPPPIIPEVTVEDLINYNRDHFDFDNISNDFINLATHIFGGGILGTCCAVSDRSLIYLDPITTLNKEQQIKFGCFIYSILQHSWNKSRNKNAPTGNGFNSIILKDKPQEFKNKYYTLSNIIINGTYIFTYATHQPVRYQEFVKLLGATEIHTGHNGRYPYDSGHDIYMYVIDRINSLPRFFEIHKEYLTNQYLTNNNQR